MTPPRSESWILFEILRNWGAHPRVRLWRNNTGVAQFGDRSVRFGVPGGSDALGLIAPWGRLWAIETKTKTGRQSDDQKRFQRMIESMGGIYTLAREPVDADRALAALGVTR